MPQLTKIATDARAAVFAPVAGGGRAQLVAARLSNAIVLGVLEDGARLPSESEMARAFGVAIVTTREALETLRLEGLIQTRRGRDGGSYVTAPASFTARLKGRLQRMSRVEVRDLAAYYTVIASGAAELAAEKSTQYEVTQIDATLAAVDSASEASTRRGEGEFRLAIAALSQSALLVREELRLQAEFAPLLWLCLGTHEYRNISIDANRSVLAAVSLFDGELARHRTRAHLAHALEWLMEEKERLDHTR